MAFMVNVPQGPDIWAGYHRSLEGIGQGIGSGVTAYLAEKKKREDAEKARQRVIKLLTERKQVEGDVLSNPPLDVSEGRQGIQTGTIADRYAQSVPDLKPTRGFKAIESIPDIPAGYDQGTYDTLAIGAMSRKLLKPWEEEDRQRKITDEKSMLDYKNKIERENLDYETELKKTSGKGQPVKELDLGNKVRVYYNDGTSEDITKGAAPGKPGDQSVQDRADKNLIRTYRKNRSDLVAKRASYAMRVNPYTGQTMPQEEANAMLRDVDSQIDMYNQYLTELGDTVMPPPAPKVETNAVDESPGILGTVGGFVKGWFKGQSQQGAYTQEELIAEKRRRDALKGRSNTGSNWSGTGSKW